MSFTAPSTRLPRSSLRAFFAPKPTQSGRSANDAVDLTDSPPRKRARPSSPTSPAPPPAKRTEPPKASGSSSSYFKKPARAPSTAQPASFEQYRLPRRSEADGEGSASSPRPPRSDEQQARHEAFCRVVGGAGFGRRRSLLLDEAAAEEVRKAVGDDSDGPSADATHDAEDGAAATLRAKYAAAPAKRGRKKKEEELGPSGMTYTPLEKQFMEIKAKWPDVLLMTEGEPPSVSKLTRSRVQVQVPRGRREDGGQRAWHHGVRS